MNIPGKTMAGVMEAPIPKIMGPASGRRDVLSFAQGLPWFGPPSAALTRTLERLRNGEGDGYSDDSGRGSLRELAASDLQKRGLAGIKPANILLTPGANQAVFIALSVLADPGDEVILFRPYYFNNLMALQMLGLKPVIVETDPEGRIDPAAVRTKISTKTRAMIVISPDNPTGAVIEKEIRDELLSLSRAHGFAYLSDEAYRDFAWDNPHVPAPTGEADNAVGIYSFSKSFGMAGWRLGFLAGSERLAAEAVKAADTLHICPPVPAQILAEEVLLSEPDYPERFRDDLRRSRDILVAALRPLWEEGLAGEPQSSGGFYIYLRLSPGTPQSGWDISRRLVDEHGIAVVPGEAFGTNREPHIRLSYGNIRAADMPRAAARLAEALNKVLPRV